MFKRNTKEGIIRLFLLTIILLSKYSNAKLSKSNVIIAINCGGNDYTDSNGITYIEDKYYDQGTPSDHGLNYEITGTKDQNLYQTERWSSSTMTYNIPLIEPGKYTFVLKFSEVFFGLENQKVFDVALGNKKVITNLDIFKKVGKASALDEYVEFELKNGKIYVGNDEAKNAYDNSEKTLALKFIKGTKDNPKINAILLVKGSKSNTDYDEKQKAMSESNKAKLKEQRKQLTLDLRHDSDEDYSESLLLDGDVDELKIKEGSIFSIFNTTPGYAIIISIILFFILNYLINFIG